MDYHKKYIKYKNKYLELKQTAGMGYQTKTWNDHPDFKLGSKEFWEISKNMGDDDEDEAYDPSKGKKGKGGQINVKKTKW
jgi:hypothetical protein